MTEPHLIFPRFEGDALCAQVSPDLWFPEPGRSNAYAKSVCKRCDVRDQCLDWALKTDERWGVWGGLGEADRQQIRRDLAKRKPPKPHKTGRPSQPINHGTDGGAAAHRYRGEQPCQSCAAAANVAWALRQKKDECPVCGEWMLKSSIRRHMGRRHADAQEDVA